MIELQVTSKPVPRISTILQVHKSRTTHFPKMCSSHSRATIESELNSEKVDSLHKRGNELYKSKQYREAHSVYSAAIEILCVSIPTATFTTISPLPDTILLSRLYHNRALTKTKLNGETASEEALADARRATELDPSYMKAWLLCARLLAKAADRDMRKVYEALDDTHRVMELELWQEEALEMMRELVDCEMKSRLESALLSDTNALDQINIAAALLKLDSIHREDELENILIQSIRSLFEVKRLKHEAASMKNQLIEAEAKLYNALSAIFFKMVNYHMAISCSFLSINLFDQLVLSPQVRAMKVIALSNLQAACLSSGQEAAQHAQKWIKMALQLHNEPDSAEGARLRMNAAEVHMHRLEYARGLEGLKECLQVCKLKGYREVGAKVRVKMALALCELGNFEAALTIAEEAKSEFKHLGHEVGVALALKNIGTAQLGLKQYDNALKTLKKALDRNPDPVEVFEIRNLIGNVYWYKARDCTKRSDSSGAETYLQNCEEYYLGARNQAIKNRDKWRLLKAETNLARTYVLLDKSEKKTLWQNSLTILLIEQLN